MNAARKVHLYAFTRLDPLIILLCIALIVGSLCAPAVPNALGSSTSSAGGVTIEFHQADIRDAFSALAVKMGATIILAQNSSTQPAGNSNARVDFKVSNVTTMQAVNMLAQMNGMETIARGSIIIVGNKDTLNNNFYDQMILARFRTKYVSAEELKKAFEDLKLDARVTLSSVDTNSVWVEGTAQVLSEVRKIINAVDTADNSLSMDYRTITLTRISTERMLKLLKSAGISFNRYVALNNKLIVFDREYFSSWNEIMKLAKQFDTPSTGEQKVFVYRLNYISAKDAAAWLDSFGIGSEASQTTSSGSSSTGITIISGTSGSSSGTGTGSESNPPYNVITFNNAENGRDLMVICRPEYEEQIRAALAQLDVKRAEVKRPLLKATYQKCNAVRVFLNELTGVSLSKMHISGDLADAGESSPSKDYVLWVEESPDKIQLMKDLLSQAGIASNSSSGESTE